MSWIITRSFRRHRELNIRPGGFFIRGNIDRRPIAGRPKVPDKTIDSLQVIFRHFMEGKPWHGWAELGCMRDFYPLAL